MTSPAQDGSICNSPTRSSPRLLDAATAMIRHNADRLDHRLQSANPPGLPLAVHHAADPTAEASFAVGRAVARISRCQKRKYFRLNLLQKPVIGRVFFAGSRRRGTVSGRDVASEGWR